MHYCRQVTLLSVIAGAGLAAANLDFSLGWSWLLVFGPLYCGLVVAQSGFHLAVYLLARNDQHVPQGFLLVCAHCIGGALLTFVLLLGLQLEEYMSVSWVWVFLPLWFGAVMCGVFIVFLVPGLLDKKVAMKRCAVLLVAYYIAGLAVILEFQLMLMAEMKLSWEIPLTILCVFLFHMGTVLCVYAGRSAVHNATEPYWVLAGLVSSFLFLVQTTLVEDLLFNIALAPVSALLLFTLLAQEVLQHRTNCKGYKELST